MEEIKILLGEGASHKVKFCAPLPQAAAAAAAAEPPPPLPKIVLGKPELDRLASLLKSGLQKSVRLGRADEAVHIAAVLLSLVDEGGMRAGETALLRRLPIIFVEDALAHHVHLPFLCWLVGAHSKGYSLDASHHAQILDAVRAVASTPWRESVTGGSSGGAPPPPAGSSTLLEKVAEAHDDAGGLMAMVGAMLVRVSYAVDHHITDTLKVALQQPGVAAAISAASSVSDASRLADVCREAMWHCSSALSPKREWMGGQMPPPPPRPHAETAMARRYSGIWDVLKPHCERFANEYIQRMVGSRSALFAAAADAQAARRRSSAERGGGGGGRIISEGLPAHPIAAVAKPELAGLYLVEDFLSPSEETALLRWLDREQNPGWQIRNFNGPAYGMRWGVWTDLKKRTVHQGSPMPPELFWLTERMRLVPGSNPLFGSWEANEANALKYVKADGHYLGAHCDDRQLSGEILVNLSLGGDAFMTYTHDRTATATAAAGGAASGGASERPPVKILLPRRSLQVQTGSVRFDYRHGISNADLLDGSRVSITFRKAKLSE